MLLGVDFVVSDAQGKPVAHSILLLPLGPDVEFSVPSPVYVWLYITIMIRD